MLHVSVLRQILRMSFFKVFCSFILFVIFSYGLHLGFILESRITGSVFYSSLSVVSIGLMEALCSCFKRLHSVQVILDSRITDRLL